MMNKSFRAVPVLSLLITAACGGAEEAAPAAEAASAAPVPAVEAAATPTSGSVAPAPGGQVIEIRMTMANGGSFEPSEITAKRGDVLRFVNVDNVHNVNFPAAENPGATGLPAPSPYLTTPGQAYELKVELQPGTYDFRCDPHMAMGMTGQLTVTE